MGSLRRRKVRSGDDGCYYGDFAVWRGFVLPIRVWLCEGGVISVRQVDGM